MNERYHQLYRQMKAATTPTEADSLITEAFRCYISDGLSYAEYASLYALGISIANK